MSDLFIDTSALSKRYFPEVGTFWMRRQVQRSSGNRIIISALTTVEIVSVIERQVRERKISSRNGQRVISHFLLHANRDYTVIQLNDPVLATARTLLSRYPLRSLDSIQLACALEYQRLFNMMPQFLSGDVRLLAAASAENLPTDDPNQHP